MLPALRAAGRCRWTCGDGPSGHRGRWDGGGGRGEEAVVRHPRDGRRLRNHRRGRAAWQYVHVSSPWLWWRLDDRPAVTSGSLSRSSRFAIYAALASVVSFVAAPRDDVARDGTYAEPRLAEAGYTTPADS